MGTWMNNDGLYIKLGETAGAAGTAGEFASVDAGAHVVEVNLDLTTLGTTAAIIDDNAIIPTGYLITKVEVLTTEAVTGTNAALNIGLIKSDRSSAYDVDGLGKAAALTQTAMAAVGTVLTYIKGTSNAGDLVGFVTTFRSYISADYDTAAFTDGTVKIRVWLQKV